MNHVQNLCFLYQYDARNCTTYDVVDNLALSYQGNQLKKAEDIAVSPTLPSSMDFKDGAHQEIEYFYDGNGNLTKDLNKGISAIQYNILNLPKRIDFSGTNNPVNDYVYSASGTKLSVVHKSATENRTDYVGTMIYENGSLKRILVDGGYIENGTCYYYLQDHLGNNRVVANSAGGMVQSTHYYPFGMPFAESGNADWQPYKYNGKELDSKIGLNCYDYGARHYDAALGRFMTVDPSAENYFNSSPYAYCGNNPITRIDPDGMDWYEKANGDLFWQEGSEELEGYTNIGSCASIRFGKGSYLNFYQNGGVKANQAVNAFDLIASDSKLQNLFLGKDSPLSEDSKSSLFNSLNSRSLDAIARPIGEAVVGLGAGELGGALLGKAVGWISGKVAGKFIGEGYASFSGFKKAHGAAGEGMAWHHVVEQNAENIARFGAEKIHNTNNLIRLPHGKGSIHAKISGYYSSKTNFTNGLTVRQWLSTQSYAEQYRFGLKTLKQYGWKP